MGMTASLGHYPKYKSQPLRPPEEMRADILALERETESHSWLATADRRSNEVVCTGVVLRKCTHRMIIDA